jgi:hypothetical protein
MKRKPLTVTLHIGGKQVESLTDEQTEKMAERLSESMSRYYTANPGEFKEIKK